VWQHLDRNTLFRLHWGGHRAKGAAYQRVVEEVFEPELARLQDEAVRGGWLQPKVVWGAFPCNSEDDSLVIYAGGGEVAARLSFPRQPDGERLCLADYFRPRESGERDTLVLQAVTAGAAAGASIEDLQKTGDYSRMLYVNGLASSTAEALADWCNARVRRELGLDPGRGLRFSWGYAACPDLSAQRDVLRLLRADELIQLRLSDSDNLDPEHSTVALVVHHPQAKYFAVRADVAV
jgi:5-methyltetrahydrofolate--homocysteine methyltransferase